MPAYDEDFPHGKPQHPHLDKRTKGVQDCIWVGSALSADGHDWEEPWEDVRIHLDLASSLETYGPNPLVVDEFNNRPRYRFATTNAVGCMDGVALNYNRLRYLTTVHACMPMPLAQATILVCLMMRNWPFPTDTFWTGVGLSELL